MKTSPSSSIKVSVLVAVYNQEVLVVKALDSIPRRDDLEVIVTDDCSTDGTYRTLENYLKGSDMNYVLMRNEKNVHTASTLNRCKESASGEYIVQLDSDDEFLPEFSKVIDEAQGDIVWFDMVVNDGTVWSRRNQEEICDHACLFRRSLVEDVRWLDGDRFGGGWYFTQEALKKPHTEFWTDITAYRYNFPREGSIMYNITNELQT